MVLETGTMRLIGVREALRGKINDVWICAEEGEQKEQYYTVWLIHDHETAKRVFGDFCKKQQENPEMGTGYTECFLRGTSLCFSFPYYPERTLERFYRKEIYDRATRFQFMKQLVAVCMTSEMPDTLLCLLLSQGQIQLERNGTIRFRYIVDLQEYSAEYGREDCVCLCAEQIDRMLAEEGKSGLAGRKVLERKLERDGYDSMEELFRDVQLFEGQSDHRKVLKRVQTAVKDRKHRLLRMAGTLCLVLAGTALCMLLSQMIWGEIPFFRLFQDSFEIIGTESLLQ